MGLTFLFFFFIVFDWPPRNCRKPCRTFAGRELIKIMDATVFLRTLVWRISLSLRRCISYSFIYVTLIIYIGIGRPNISINEIAHSAAYTMESKACPGCAYFLNKTILAIFRVSVAKLTVSSTAQYAYRKTTREKKKTKKWSENNNYVFLL